MGDIIQSFKAFNLNGYSNLVYTMTQNIWFVLIAISVVTIVVLSLKKEIDETVREQQNIL